MPVSSDSDFGQLEFRNDEIRHFPRRIEDQGTPFGRIVAAVFVALCLFGALQLIVGMIAYRAFVAEVERLGQQWEREAQQSLAEMTRVASPPTAQAPRQTSVALPRYIGPIEARKRGEQTACIGGRISHRLPDGWNQSRSRCTATTQ